MERPLTPKPGDQIINPGYSADNEDDVYARTIGKCSKTMVTFLSWDNKYLLQHISIKRLENRDGAWHIKGAA